MGSPGRCTRATRASAARIGCRSRTSPPANATRSAARIVELVPDERLVYTDKFDDPNLPGEMRVTVTLKKVLVGTELNITQEGIPDRDPRRDVLPGVAGIAGAAGEAGGAGDSGLAGEHARRKLALGMSLARRDMRPSRGAGADAGGLVRASKISFAPPPRATLSSRRSQVCARGLVVTSIFVREPPMPEFARILQFAMESGASDVHLQAGFRRRCGWAAFCGRRISRRSTMRS